MPHRQWFAGASLLLCLVLCSATVGAEEKASREGAEVVAQPSVAQSSVAQPSLAMTGTPKYPASFSHFDYVNPTAPKGGILHLGVTGSFDSLNPFVVRGNPALGLNLGYMSLVYESLMARSWDEPFTLYGLIAASVEVPPDRSAIVFNLRPEAHWQDGVPLTADDVMFSFTTLRDQGRPNHRTYYKRVAKAEKIDDHKIRFVFKPNADGTYDREMPLIMGLMPILPAHDWADRAFNQTTLRPPVGSGPFKIAKVEVGRRVFYVRDPSYWGRALPVEQGMYNFDEVHIDYYRDDAISLQAFKAGAYDLRREADPNKWATSYDVPAVKEGRILLERFPHQRTEPINGFAFNTRRPMFQDLVLRKALNAAFDFTWINHNLFHDLYKRSQSYFPNAELATKFSAPPVGDELAILEKFKDKLPPHLLTDPLPLPQTDGGEESLRQALLQAAESLKAHGYVLKDGLLYAPNGAKVAFEVLLSDPVEEKIALQWGRALKRLGVELTAHTVDSAQYQARLASFDYDVTVAKWTNSLSPGNEQMTFWSSTAANQQGSRNYAGVRDPVVDALAGSISGAASRDQLVATVRALDRVLLAGFYIVPFYHLGADQFAFWKKLGHPDRTPLYGQVIETWWDIKANEP